MADDRPTDLGGIPAAPPSATGGRAAAVLRHHGGVGADRVVPATAYGKEGRAMAEDVFFTRGPARRPVLRVADPLLHWSTGVQTNQRTIYAGWLIATGQSARLDDALRAAGLRPVTIRHSSGTTMTHWAVEVADLFVLAEGVQRMSEMKVTADRYGIAFNWRTLPDGQTQALLKMRVLLRDLLAVGYTEPLLVSVKSTLTGELLTALLRQYDVLDAIDRERAAKHQPLLLPPFYACSIPLGPGTAVARGPTQKQEIVPIAAHVPTPVDRAYLVAHFIKKPWVPLIEALLDATIRWSVTTSAQMAIGADGPSDAGEPDAGSPHASPLLRDEG